MQRTGVKEKEEREREREREGTVKQAREKEKRHLPASVQRFELRADHHALLASDRGVVRAVKPSHLVVVLADKLDREGVARVEERDRGMRKAWERREGDREGGGGGMSYVPSTPRDFQNLLAAIATTDAQKRHRRDVGPTSPPPLHQRWEECPP